MKSVFCESDVHQGCLGPRYGCSCDCHLNTKKGMMQRIRYLELRLKEAGAA